MTTMKTRFKYMVMALLAVMAGAAGCQMNELVPEIVDGRNDGFIDIEFTADIPAMSVVRTRSVDVDGGGIQSLVLFCFDEYNTFITTVRLESKDMSISTPTTGSFSAKVPDNTKIVHFIANQNMTNYPEDKFRNMSEAGVLGLLESSSGRMVYWARFEAKGNIVKEQDSEGNVIYKNFGEELEAYHDNHYPSSNTNLSFIRNHALISIENTTDNLKYFRTEGFKLHNYMAFGTVAPMHPTYGYNYSWAEHTHSSSNEGFVTLPANRTRIGDAVDVRYEATNMSSGSTLYGEFAYECDNPLEDPVSVILYGRNALLNADGTPQTNAAGEIVYGNPAYYRVMLQDSNGDMLKIRRNHQYQINIKGTLRNGHGSYAAATAANAAATNNIWIAIEDKIAEVANADYTLSVARTSYILTGYQEGDAYPINTLNAHFNLTKNQGASVNAADPVKGDISVKWLENFDVAESFVDDGHYSYGGTFTTDNEEFGYKDVPFNGEIRVNLMPLTADEKDQKREGTLLVKYGQLQRKIKVITIKEQKFEPAWVSSQVYSDVTTTTGRAHATLMFTIPETCPKEMFPMKVYISTDELDLRSASGMALPVVKKGDEDYYGAEMTAYAEDENGDFDPDGGKVIGYKYVLDVTGPGMQRVYFENKLNQTPETDSDGKTVYQHGKITIEARHFETMYKTMEFSPSTYSINAPNMYYFNMGESGLNLLDEEVKFVLVPQKKNAPVDFTLSLYKGISGNADNPRTAIEPVTTNKDGISDGSADEMLIYSQHLDGNTGGDCSFKVAREAFWSENGRLHIATVNDGRYRTEGDNKYSFDVSMKTNTAKSAEAIRISTNESGYSYWNVESTDSSTESGVAYTGRVFRSMVFELANYNPFRFAAQVSSDSRTEPYGTVTSDVTEEVEIPFNGPGLEVVNVEFDITSFQSKPQKGANNPVVSVDPFGTVFNVYIEAPMLALDEKLLDEKGLSGKLIKERDGLFAYKVASTYKEEYDASAGYGTSAEIADSGTTTDDNGNTTKHYEAPDQTRDRKVLPFVTSNIVNAGEIKIYTDTTEVGYIPKTFTVSNSPLEGEIYYGDTAVPKGTFIAVEKVSDHTRIATLTVVEDGKYELRLRKEYESAFIWDQTDIQIFWEPRFSNNTSMGVKHQLAEDITLEDLKKSPNITLVPVTEGDSSDSGN